MLSKRVLPKCRLLVQTHGIRATVNPQTKETHMKLSSSMSERSLREEVQRQLVDAAHAVNETGSAELSLSVNHIGSASRDQSAKAFLKLAGDLGTESKAEHAIRYELGLCIGELAENVADDGAVAFQFILDGGFHEKREVSEALLALASTITPLPRSAEENERLTELLNT